MIVRIGIFRIAQNREHFKRRDQLANDFKALAAECTEQLEDAGEIAAWPIEALHHPELDRIGTNHEHDGNCRGHLLRRQRGWKTGCESDCHATAHQLHGESRQSIVMPLRPAKCDHNILSLDKTSFS
jgi:hypothetical protein